MKHGAFEADESEFMTGLKEWGAEDTRERAEREEGGGGPASAKRPLT